MSTKIPSQKLSMLVTRLSALMKSRKYRIVENKVIIGHVVMTCGSSHFAVSFTARKRGFSLIIFEFRANNKVFR